MFYCAAQLCGLKKHGSTTHTVVISSRSDPSSFSFVLSAIVIII